MYIFTEIFELMVIQNNKIKQHEKNANKYKQNKIKFAEERRLNVNFN